jgi:hypothetical protein
LWAIGRVVEGACKERERELVLEDLREGLADESEFEKLAGVEVLGDGFHQLRDREDFPE